MTDIATLSYSVDSSGLQAAERALDSQTKAADRTAQATEKLNDRYKEIARRGVEYAESTRGANQSDRSLAESAREAAEGIDTKAQVMARSGTQQERMAAATARLQAAEERASKTTKAAAKSEQLRALNLKALQGQIDPTVAKLERLAAAERRLEKARDLGVINPAVFDQYQSKIDTTRAATLKAGQANNMMTKSLGRMNLGAVETQQSVASLARSLATGQWGMASSSLTSLGARTGVLSGIFSMAALAVAGAAVAVGGVIVAFHKAEQRTSEFNKSLILTGNYVDTTALQMAALASEMDSLAGVTEGSASAALAKVAATGRFTAEQFELVGVAAEQMRASAGIALDETITKFTEIGKDPVEALLKLNDAEHFLTETQLDRIRALQDEGREQEAVTEAMNVYARVGVARAKEVEDAMSTIPSMWREIKTGTVESGDAIVNWAADVDAALGRALNSLARYRAEQTGLWRKFLNVYFDQGDAFSGVTASVDTTADTTGGGVVDSDAYTARMKSEKAAEESINRQMQSVYGLDTAVNRLEMSFGAMSEERQKALRADGSYTAMLNKAMEADAKKNTRSAATSKRSVQRASEEERAVERLLSKFQNVEESQARQLALHGETGRVAALAYDIMKTGLEAVDAKLAATLKQQAALLDMMDFMDEADAIIAENAKKAAGEVGKEMDGMSEYSKQAARNMQSSFADFLFDPFADGAENMADAFSQTIRRMLAEAAAAKFFEMIGGAMSSYTGAGAGWVNVIGGALQSDGGREYGGDVNRNGMYKTGERNKPELLSTPDGQYLIPGDHGRVDPIRAVAPSRGGAMGTPQININVTGNANIESATARPNASGGFDLDVMLKQMEGGMAGNVAMGASPFNRALESRYNLKPAV